MQYLYVNDLNQSQKFHKPLPLAAIKQLNWAIDSYSTVRYIILFKFTRQSKTYHLFPFVLFCGRLFFFCYFRFFRNGHQHATKNTNVNIFNFGFLLRVESLTKKILWKYIYYIPVYIVSQNCACSMSQMELYKNSVFWTIFVLEILVFHIV